MTHTLLAGDWMPWAAAEVTTLRFVVLVHMAVLGAAIGSFLNVVIYRLPRGESLVHPGSHCPQCSAKIRPRDNVPVLGWLILGGRCRDCRHPISPRYPLVELATALLFAAAVWIEVLQPDAGLSGIADAAAAIWQPLRWIRCGVALLVLCPLLVVALVEWDQQRVPPSVWTAPWLIAGFAPLFYPAVLFSAAESLTQAIEGRAWLVPVIHVVAAAIAAGMIALLGNGLPRSRAANGGIPRRSGAVVLAGALFALSTVIGLRTTATILLASVLIEWFAPRRPGLPASCALVPLSLLWLFTSRRLPASLWPEGDAASLAVHVSMIASTVVAVVVVRFVSARFKWA